MSEFAPQLREAVRGLATRIAARKRRSAMTATMLARAAAALGVAAFSTWALAETPAPMPKPVAVLASWGGTDSKIDTLTVQRVDDAAAWSALWARHAPGARPTEVDFAKAMVVAVFLGQVRKSVVPAMELEKVTENAEIDVTVSYFVNDVIGDGFADHYLFVVLPRSDKTIRVLAHSDGLMRAPQERVDVLATLAPPPP